MDYVQEELRDFFGGITRVVFVPFALFDHNAYAGRVRQTFPYQLYSLHQAGDMRTAIRDAEAIFIGGGNTFRLLKALYDHDLIGWIQERVHAGVPYLGSSAGSNVACPTIKTTNDMPIVQPPSFEALNLVPFQINPHYVDPDPHSKHMGETREERLQQFLQENATPVIGLREGAWLRIENGSCQLKGTNGARLFRKNCPPIELDNGSIDRFLPVAASPAADSG